MASTTQHEPNLAFTKAVLAFESNVGKKKQASQATVQAVEVAEPDPEALAIEAHEERFKKRIRIARGVQHLLTGILSLAVALLQGATYVKYQQTKNVKDAWPKNPNLLPTLMLFSTAIAGIAFDSAALIAYTCPQTDLGKKALTIALRANSVITTIKTTAYALSAVVCKAGFDFGNASGQNNDLWSWSCSAKGSKFNSINGADFTCTGNTIAWGIAIAGIAIQFIGIVIDQLVAADAKKYAPVPKDDDEESADAKSQPGGAKAKKDNSDGFDKLEKIGQDYDKQLKDQMPQNDTTVGN